MQQYAFFFVVVGQLQLILAANMWVLNQPQGFPYRAGGRSGSAWSGTNSKITRCDSGVFERTFNELTNYTAHALHGDAEAFDAMEHFFWNSCDGIVMEMGAVDGITHSVSVQFEELGWKRLLVDGNPERFDALKQRSEAFAVGAVVCESPQIFHYCINRYTPYGLTSGVVEFMTPPFIGRFHPRLYRAGKPKGSLNIDWTNANISKDCTTVQCIPLADVFRESGVSHVDFFILDIEGAELEALRTIDFTAVTFDVVVIEAARARAKMYKDKVIAHMSSHGYDRVDVPPDQAGRNLWFTRRGFKPSLRAGVKPEQFSGYKLLGSALRVN